MTAYMHNDAAYLNVDDPKFSIRSDEVLKAREKNWFARTPYGIAALRYEEVNELIKHPSLEQGSARWPEHNNVSGPWANWWHRVLLNQTGDDHTRLRKLVNPAFSPKMVNALRPVFQDLANELIDNFIDQGECEFMSEFCEPYATRVVTKLLGLPDAEWRHFADLAVSMGLALGVTFKEDLPRIEAALEELFKYADRIIAERKGKIGDDFLSTLINLEDGGDKLSEQELRDMIVLLIFGGIDTTRNQIGLALWKFMEHPNQWDKLGKAPELQAQAVEEVMRVRPTVTWVTREAVEDFTFRGLDIDKGTTIHLFSQAACSDPRIIKDNSFDIEAKGRPRHTGFGGGKHFCLGAFIARADMGEAVSILSQRLKNIQVNGEVEWFPDSGNTGPITLPIKFEKR